MRRDNMWKKDIMWKSCKRLPTDFEPYGKRSRENDWGPDCSCECKFNIELEGDLGYDWGVCFNPKSPRNGLLTFEHQGCKEFQQIKEKDKTLLDEFLEKYSETKKTVKKIRNMK